MLIIVWCGGMEKNRLGNYILIACSLKLVWLIITSKVQLTTILKVSSCINLYFVKWREAIKRYFGDKEAWQFKFKPATQLRVQLR